MKKFLFLIGFAVSVLGLFAQAPEGYYAEAAGKSGSELRSAIIDAAKRGVEKHGYNWDVDYLDEMPSKPGKVKLVYTLKEENVGSHASNGTSGYNREHVWPKSLMSPRESQKWDNQNLRASEPTENGKRGNKRYGDYLPPNETKGDCARIVFFMSLVYNWDIDIVGDEEMLIEWVHQDPVDAAEIQRNNRLQERQGNRNPFLDYPELIDYIYGDKYGETWAPEGGGVDPNPNSTLFFENFDGAFPDDWSNISVQGTNVWKQREFTGDPGNKYAQISAYKPEGADDNTEAWLVSPAISLKENATNSMTFFSKNGYFKGVTLSVLVSTNYSGDVATAEWTELSAKLDDQPHLKPNGSLGYGSEWIPSGSVSLADFSGDIHIAFKYAGTKEMSTTYQLNDVKVVSQIQTSVETVVSTETTSLVYPNPTQGNFRIKGRMMNTEAYVYNLAGQMCQTSVSEQINLKGAKAGLYFVQYMNEKGNMETKKLIKR